MDPMEELRLFGKEGSKAFVAGLYQADAGVVSDECFGDWMKGTWGDIETFSDKFFEDPFGVPTREYMDFATNAMTLVTKNADKCQWKKITDDLQDWCLDNKETCLLGAGLEKRIWDNATGIVTALADIFKMMEEDDTCQTDAEEVAQFARLFKNYGQLAAHLSGFDAKWDQSVQPKHIKTATFFDKIDDFWASTKDMTEDMLDELQFPELTQIFNNLGEMFDDIFGKIDGVFEAIFGTIDGWFNDINKALTEPIHIEPRHTTHKAVPKKQPVHHEEKHEQPKPAPQPEHHKHRQHRPEDFWGNMNMNGGNWGGWGMPKWDQWKAPQPKQPEKHVIHTVFGDLEV